MMAVKVMVIDHFILYLKSPQIINPGWKAKGIINIHYMRL